MLLILSHLLLGEGFWRHCDLEHKVSLRAIAVVDVHTVWVGGTEGTLAYTRNSGRNWDYYTIPDTDLLDFRDIEAFGPVVYAMSAGPGKASRIYKTWDDGEHWRLQYTCPHEKGFLNAIAFWDDQNGVALSDPINGFHLLLRTSDGGSTWQELAPEGWPSMQEGEYGFAGSGSNMISSGDSDLWLVTGGNVSRLWHSSDRGNHWQVQPTAILAGQDSTGLFSIAGRGERWVAVGGDYKNPEAIGANAMFSLDNGKTWQLAETQPPYRSCVKFLHAPQQLTAISVGPNGSSISTDGGVNWQALQEEGFNALAITPGENLVWAVGSDGRVARRYFSE